MTEEVTYCIRGCVSPCECPACQECDQPIHPPPRVQTEDGSMLCKRDVARIRRWLIDIPDLYTTLPLLPTAGADNERRGKAPKPAGDVSPIRLDVVALQDPRTSATDLTGAPWDGSAYIPDEVGTWALLLAEEHNITSSVRTITDATGLLLRWLGELCASPWVDECYDALRECHRLLATAHRIDRPSPLGRCINTYERGGKQIACQAMLYGDGTSKVKCRSCGARYDGTRMLLVRRQGMADKREAVG